MGPEWMLAHAVTGVRIDEPLPTAGSVDLHGGAACNIDEKGCCGRSPLLAVGSALKHQMVHSCLTAISDCGADDLILVNSQAR
jgi:hypothetical protein